MKARKINKRELVRNLRFTERLILEAMLKCLEAVRDDDVRKFEDANIERVRLIHRFHKELNGEFC